MASKLTIEAISRAMNRVAPLRLAESWDNVGLLVGISLSLALKLSAIASFEHADPVIPTESPVPKRDAKRIFFTIDLTEAVVNEALSDPQKPTAAIICYHPPLFRALKSITLSNPLQACMLKCAMNGISLYSPHTSVDAIKGGVNDWLVDVVSGGNKAGITVEILQQVKGAEGEEGVGMGRKVIFIQLARASQSANGNVQSVALCAGSGGSVIGNVPADLYFTGEMSHHEVLAAVARRTHVLLCGHSNTERGYLPQLKVALEQALREDGVDLTDTELLVSKADRDPLEVV